MDVVSWFFTIFGSVLFLVIILYIAIFQFVLHGCPKGISNYEGKHVVITGGSAGLGKSIAIKLSKQGANLSLISRSMEKLQKVQEQANEMKKSSDQKINIYSTDVSKWNDIEATIKKAVEENGPVDIVIANAGASFPGYFAEIPMSTLEKEIQLNYLGVVYTIKASLDSMIKNNKGGHISIISSAAAFVPMIGYSNYGSTKGAIRSLADGLRNELLLYNIGVSIYFPTGIDTEGFVEENKSKPEETKEIESSSKVSSPDSVADVFLNGLRRGQYYITNELMTELLRTMGNGVMAPRNNFILDLFLASISTFISPAIRYFGMDSVVIKSRNNRRKQK